MTTSFFRTSFSTLLLMGLVAACSDSGVPTSSPNGSLGGANSQGGAIGNGGSVTGGLPSNTPMGGATGYSTSVVPSTGGNAPGAGGASSNSPTGGAASGGKSSAGGAPTGGALATGGGAATGGSQSAPAGGAASGGKSLAGGAAAGGKSAVGGAATGGKTASDGGAASGGKSTGTGGTTSAPGTGTPSSGCSLASVTTGTAIDSTMTISGQSTAREYRLSVPADYVPGEPLPVVFVFNGVGGTGPQAQQFFQVEAGHRAIFVYPTALPNSQASGSIAWDFSSTGVDVPFFDALVTYVTQNYCVDTNRIFALGASSGAIFANMLGCFRGNVLRAIAPSSGMDWQQGGCKGDVAVIIICGAQDSYNPCSDAKNGAVSETNVWVPQNSCTTTTAASPISDICVAYQGCKAADPVLLCTQPGGHGWPTSNGDFWWQFFMSLT